MEPEHISILSEIVEPTLIKNAFHFRAPRDKGSSHGVDGDSETITYLVLYRGSNLEFYGLEDSTLTLIDVEDFTYPHFGKDEVPTTLTTYKTKENDFSLILYYESIRKLCHFTYKGQGKKFKDDFTINLQDVRLPKTIESTPLLLVSADIGKSSRYLILHAFQGYLHAFDLESQKMDAVVSYMGAITVLFMTFLTNNKRDSIEVAYLAVVYRDFNFNSSLRYYKLENGAFVLHKQFNDFDGEPLGIQALANGGGLLVFSEIHAFYFPPPDMNLGLSDELELSNSISLNTRENMITKVLVENSRDLEKAKLSNFVMIDDNRLLAMSKGGVAFMIYIDIDHFGQRRIVTLNSFDVIRLDFATVCEQLLYLGHGKFFGASQFSRSVLFTVGPESPYIHIESEMQSSPPVLSIEACGSDIFTCQGGYASGEFRNVCKTESAFRTVHIDSNTRAAADDLIPSTNKLQIQKVGDPLLYSVSVLSKENSIINNWDLNIIENEVELSEGNLGSVFSGQSGILNWRTKKANKKEYSVAIKDSGIYLHGTEPLYSYPIVDGTFTPGSDCVLISEQKGQKGFEVTYIQISDHKARKTASIHLNGNEYKNSDFIGIKSSKSIVLITFRNYYLVLEIFDSEANFAKVYGAPIGNVFSSDLTYNELSDEIWVFLTLEDGQVVTINLQRATGDNDIENAFSQKPFKTISLNSNSQLTSIPSKVVVCDSQALIFNRSTVEQLLLNPTSNFYESKQLAIKRDAIQDVSCLGEFAFVILYESGSVEIFQRDDSKFGGVMIPTVFSNSLNLKSLKIPNSVFSVVLCSESRYSEEKGAHVSVSFLKVVNCQTMEEIFKRKYTLKHLTNPVDICYQYSNQFLVLDNNPDYPIRTFEIDLENGKISPLQAGVNYNHNRIQELDFEMKFQSLKNLQDNSFLVSGSKFFVVEQNTDYTWKRVSQKHSQRVYTSNATYIKGKIAVLDVIGDFKIYELQMGARGVYHDFDILLSKYNLNPEYPLKYNQNLYSTSIASTWDDDSRESFSIYVGDSGGNIDKLIIEEGDWRIKKFKVDSPVNCICPVKSRETNKFENSFMNSGNNYRAEEEVIITPQIVFGTMNGGVNMISTIECRNVSLIRECYKELCEEFLTTTPSLKFDSEDDGPNTPDDDSSYLSGRLFKKFLAASVDEEFSAKFPICSENRSFIERIVYETEGIR